MITDLKREINKEILGELRAVKKELNTNVYGAIDELRNDIKKNSGVQSLVNEVKASFASQMEDVQLQIMAQSEKKMQGTTEQFMQQLEVLKDEMRAGMDGEQKKLKQQFQDTL